MLLRKIYYLLGPRLRRTARKIFYFPADFLKLVTGSRRNLVPPKGMIYTGGGDFIKQGDLIQTAILKLCELRPIDHVLDIGCGIGRIARPMSQFLNSEGSYNGFDIVKEGIEWCESAYKNHSNFTFLYIPLQNDLYNLSTKEKASSFRFPYADRQFDLVVLTSVFTHMQEADVFQYLKEIGRVIKSGKSCFCTFFIITPESDHFLKNSSDPFFKYRFDNYFLHDKRVKDANIAYKYDVIEKMLPLAGLKLKSFHPGWWAGFKKEDCVNFQDIMILTTLN